MVDSTNFSARRTPLVNKAGEGYHLLSAPASPSIIVEAGFMSNPTDLEYIVNNTNTIVEAIAKGIVNYYTLH